MFFKISAEPLRWVLNARRCKTKKGELERSFDKVGQICPTLLKLPLRIGRAFANGFAILQVRGMAKFFCLRAKRDFPDLESEIPRSDFWRA